MTTVNPPCTHCHRRLNRTIEADLDTPDESAFPQVGGMIFGSRADQLEIAMSHPPLTFHISGKHMQWMDQGACNGTSDWTMFFADERAKRRGLPAEVPPEVDPFCQACTVRLECLTWALENDEEGVWGGTTRQQREAMKRPIVRAKCPACQSGNLFRTGIQQVCGDCGCSWQATKIHGNARAAVDPPLGDAPLPLHPGNVIRLPIKWAYEQAALFDAAAFRVAKRRRARCSRKRRRPCVDQPQLPGLAGVVAGAPRQVRTRPTVPPRVVAA